ncbi:cell division protein SepF [Nanchangia anserum]|uniref:Cell division protein SepF n=1 Tax=Nanchangia anserum TaxID=2692125 RepID=A0A8I0KWR2_9ACTO|nr:cell division protein SepF [Nanchangia anserum]MBD3690234.1 cell division protein SepF [Nanchangia anserum]QOX82322.1 cell division protein SepF [Nanchangia anserum]
MVGVVHKAMDFMGLSEPKMGADEDAHDYVDDYDYDFDDSDRDTGSDVTPFPAPQVVSSGSDVHRIVTIKTTNFDTDATRLGDAFREGVPVILNVTGMKEGDARRLIDFAAGLVYGLRGKLERVTHRVFLLSPETVAVSAVKDDSTRGFFD